MTMTNKDSVFAQIVRKLDPQNTLLRTWKPQGGISAQVTAFEVMQADGQTQKLLVRQHGALDLKRNPQIAVDEFKLLQLLQSAHLTTPKPYFVDQSGEILPTPYIIIEYIEGQQDFAPANLPAYILQLTTHLASIHQVDCAELDFSFLPLQTEICAEKLQQRQANPDESLAEGRIRDALEAAWPLTQRNPSRLLHGDFWPGNTLWRDGQLVAVIDWEDAARGDPLADLANARLEILWTFGSDAMHSFTRQYQNMIALDCRDLPYWDLYAALRAIAHAAEWPDYEAGEKRMREGHRLFIMQAFEKVSR